MKINVIIEGSATDVVMLLSKFPQLNTTEVKSIKKASNSDTVLFRNATAAHLTAETCAKLLKSVKSVTPPPTVAIKYFCRYENIMIGKILAGPDKDKLGIYRMRRKLISGQRIQCRNYMHSDISMNRFDKVKLAQLYRNAGVTNDMIPTVLVSLSCNP